jgi:Lactonase, 7-bladed beta-propeller
MALVAAVAVCASASASASSGAGAAGPPASGSLAASRPAAAAAAIGCTRAVATAPLRRRVQVSLLPVPDDPFGVVTARRHWAFVTHVSPLAPRVSVSGVYPAGSARGRARAVRGSLIGVYRTGSFVPRLVRNIAVPALQALGETLTPDGRYLLAATAEGAVVLSVARAESGAASPVLGVLPVGVAGGSGPIEVRVSPDGRFAFVSLEDSAELAVFNLGRALRHGFGAADLVGYVPTGQSPVGMAISPDGRWLYATSESEQTSHPAPDAPGTLSVISLRMAERDPARAVVAAVTAGCQPVRVVTSADGAVVWVTARASDALVAFSAARLRSAPGRSVLADVRVGEEPVGLALVRGGRRMIVADSDRSGIQNARSSLAVVAVPAALAGRPALLGLVRAGGFPREMALEPGGATLLVTNFASGQLEAVGLARLP